MRPYLLNLFVGITYAATTPQLAAEPARVALAALSATHSSHNSDASSEGALMSDEAKTRDRANIIEPMIGPGILNYRDGIPDGETLFDLIPALGKLPSNPSNQCILFPTYANWTGRGWNTRMHGHYYRELYSHVSPKSIRYLASLFSYPVPFDELPVTEQHHAIKAMGPLLSARQINPYVRIEAAKEVTYFSPGYTLTGDPPRNGVQTIVGGWKGKRWGDFDFFSRVSNITHKVRYNLAGNATSKVQTLHLRPFTLGTHGDKYPGRGSSKSKGSTVAYLIPPHGMTILSDIDDVLRETRIYVPQQAILNTFVRPFKVWMNMHQIFSHWSSSIPDLHFHYMTTTPEQLAQYYLYFLYRYYPLGSFDTHPMSLASFTRIQSSRQYYLEKIFETFPQRQFVLIGDTTNPDIMKQYPVMYKKFPEQVQCIFIRNTTVTDKENPFGYDTSGFKDVPESAYMFFNVPDDLSKLDIANGECRNSTLKSNNVEYRIQGGNIAYPTDEDGTNAAHRAPTTGATTSIITMLVLFLHGVYSLGL